MKLRFQTQAIVSLIGGAVLHGTIMDRVPMIQVRVEYFIVGPSEANAPDVFISALLSDLENTTKEGHHIVMGECFYTSAFKVLLCRFTGRN